ncbi:MAG: outer membrane protein assembly factor [Capsulimonadaceae bacterium]
MGNRKTRRAQWIKIACALTASAIVLIGRLAPAAPDVSPTTNGPAAATTQPVAPAPANGGPPAAAPATNEPASAPILPAAPAPASSGQSAPAESATPAAPPAATAVTGRIVKISISGNKNISTQAILSVLSQKTGDQYSSDDTDKDRDAIHEMGYFNGEVGLSVTADPAGGVDETYSVVENPVIKKIVFTANTPNGEPSIPAAKLESMMNTKVGQVLNTNIFEADLDRLFDRISGYTAEQGYLIDPSPDLNLDPLTDVLTIPLIEAHIDHIYVTGNHKTKTVVITREMRTKPGDVYNENVLQKDLQRIYNLKLFDNVGPYRTSATEVGKIDLTIPVVEKRSGQVSVGVGYSTRDKLLGRAQLAESNFRGLDETISLTWEVDAVNAGSSVDLAFFEPYLDSRHTSLSVDLFDRALYRFTSDNFGPTVGSTNTYIEQHKGISISVNRPIATSLTAGLSGRVEDVHVNNVQLPSQDLYIRQIGPVAAVGANATQNTKDNDASPATGALRSISVEVGTSSTTTVDNTPGPLVPGVHNFVKGVLDLRQYISLQGPRRPGHFNDPKKVLAIHFLGQVTNRQVPFWEQYFLGGADSVRSLLVDRFWGNNLALVQVELRLPVGKNNNLQAVIFSDAGSAWGSIYQDPQLNQETGFVLSSDVGVGVRFVTPVGPIRLDYAVGSGGGRTQFSIAQTF